MKKIYLMSLAALSLGLSSCDMDAPSQSATDAQTVFTTESMAESAVMAIHVSFCETNSYRGRYLPYYGLNTDCEWINGGNSYDTDKYQLCQYNPQSNSQQMNTTNNAYAKFYEGIERANQAIHGLRQYSDQSNETFRQLLGEALTLRAVIYTDLIKGWGDVPARFEPITSESLYLPRTDRDIIYKQLLADLLEAEDLVGWPNENDYTSSTERVNKAFVKSLRARIALYAGGYAYRADGQIRLSRDPELAPATMYSIAAKECEDIINQGCNVLGTFEENFRRLCEENTAAGRESIYELPFSDGRGRVLYTLGVLHKTVDKYTQQPRGGVNGPLPNLYYDYSVNDARRDITCVPYSWNNGVQNLDNTNCAKWCFGKLRYEWMTRVVTSTNDDGINWQFMRLADVYMMAAEAENQLGNTSAAWNYLEPVLSRSLPSNEVAALKTKYTASQAAFQLGIEEQRKFEFTGEMLRKADLIRWNKLTTNLQEALTRMNALYNGEAGTSANGAYDYSDLPKKLYFTTAADGESIIIYGLNHGDTDEAGAALGYDEKTWRTSSTLQTNAAYLFNPEVSPLESKSVWPIWDNFVSSSNNTLTPWATEVYGTANYITEY